MPPEEKDKREQKIESAPRQPYLSHAEARAQAEEEEEKNQHAAQVNQQPNSVFDADLAARLAPTGKAQNLRNAFDAATSGVGGFFGGGPPGAAIGAGTSIFASLMNPNQGQSLGSATTAANIVLPGLSKALNTGRLIAPLMKNSPLTTGAAIDATEGTLGGAASAYDTNQNIGQTAAGSGFLTALLGFPGRAFQSGAKKTPAYQSPGVRQQIAGMVDTSLIPQGPNAARGLLDTLTNQTSRLSPYVQTAAEKAEEAAKLKIAQAQKLAAEGRLKKGETVLAGRLSAEGNLEGLLDIEKSQIKQAAFRDVDSAKDFLDAYPTNKAAIEAEITAIKRSPRWPSQAAQGEVQKLEGDLAKLEANQKQATILATRTQASTAAVRQAREVADSPLHAKLRKARMATERAVGNVSRMRQEIESYAKQMTSLATNQQLRQEAFDELTAQGIADPRLLSDESVRAIRYLAEDKTISPETFFRRTVEAPKNAEAITNGLMDFIGKDKATRAAIQSRYVEHLFDTLQRGFNESITGKTFEGDLVSDYMKRLSQNKGAINSMFGNDDAYDTIYKLMEKLRESSEAIQDPAMKMRISVGTVGIGAAVGSHLVATDSEGPGDFIIKAGAALAGGSAAAYALSWKSVVNKFLQGPATADRKAMLAVITAKDITRIPKDTLRVGLRAMMADAKPLSKEELAAIEAQKKQPATRP